MNPDRESLLAATERDVSPTTQYNNNSLAFRIKKNLLLLVVSLLIATCLTIYLYLNLVAIDGNQSDPNRYKPLSRRKPMLDHESIFSDSGPSMIRVDDLLAHCIVALQVAGKEVVKLSLINKSKLDQVGSKGQTLEGADDVVTGADLKSHQMILNTIKDSYRRLNVISEEDTTTAFENTRPEDDILPIDRVQFATMLRENLHHIEGQQGTDKNSLIAQHETLVWIDPLDATKEYSENLTDYVTLMACIVHKSIPIAGVIHKPFTNQTYWSIKDETTGKYHHSLDLTRLIQKRHQFQEDNKTRFIVSRSHAGDVKDVLSRIYNDDRVRVVSAGGSGYKTIELAGNRVDAYVHMTRIKKWDICAPHSIVESLPGGRMTNLDGGRIEFGDPKDKVVTRGLIASFDNKLHQELVGSFRSIQNKQNDNNRN